MWRCWFGNAARTSSGMQNVCVCAPHTHGSWVCTDVSLTSGSMLRPVFSSIVMQMETVHWAMGAILRKTTFVNFALAHCAAHTRLTIRAVRRRSTHTTHCQSRGPALAPGFGMLRFKTSSHQRYSHAVQERSGRERFEAGRGGAAGALSVFRCRLQRLRRCEGVYRGHAAADERAAQEARHGGVQGALCCLFALNVTCLLRCLPQNASANDVARMLSDNVYVLACGNAYVAAHHKRRADRMCLQRSR